MLTSDFLKLQALKHLRFKLGYKLVATEFEYLRNGSIFKCDIIGMKENNHITEIEIKCTWADFLNDFKKKKHDNECYMIANSFYFMAEKELAEKISEYLDKNNMPYGVYAFREKSCRYYDRKIGEYGKMIQDTTMIRRCKKIFKNDYNESLKYRIHTEI